MIINGFIVAFDEDKTLSEEIARMIDGKRRKETLSETLSTGSWERGGKEIFAVSLDGETLYALCLGVRKKKVTTFKYRVEFSDFVRINPVLSLEEINQNEDLFLKDHFIRVSSVLGHKVPFDSWTRLIEFIKQKQPELSDKIGELFEKRNWEPRIEEDKQIELLQRDATTTSFVFSGMEKSKVETVFQKVNQADKLPPHIAGLEKTVFREDRILEHDSKIFSNWKNNKPSPAYTAQYQQGDKILTIDIYNRTPVEELLGVDLLYYNHFYKSYVLIQYKRFVDDIFRLSERSYKKELENMTELERQISKKSQRTKTIEDYRFHNGLCYFKLVDPVITDFHSNSMIPGRYIPLDYWNQLTESERTTGLHGGKLITPENIGRHFNNTHFIDLVKHGWIGSTAIQSEMLAEIINDILDGKRLLTVAEYVRKDN